MDIFTLLDELQTIARNGLYYSSDAYDLERYERLMTLATQSYQELLDIPDEQTKSRFANELGYITPKVGADAAIFDNEGKILLMDRADGSGWCLPCGWVEPNEKPVETVVREVQEETGLDVVVKQLVGVFTRVPSVDYGPHTIVAVVHLCEVMGGELTLSHEGLDLQYCHIDTVTNWHGNHEKFARLAYKAWSSDQFIPAISD
ncbi:MAG: NUDIX hydrolase N-terminal domain-containing protein [Chloroflexota bacterium]